MNKIIHKEKGNHIYINISSGSSLATIAGTMGSMMFSNGGKIIPYYVKPEKDTDLDLNDKERRTLKRKYGGIPLSVGIKEIEEILTFPLNKPSVELIFVLKHILKKGKEITKSELIRLSKEELVLKKKRESQANIVSESGSLGKQEKIERLCMD